MSRFLSDSLKNLKPYVPGEQPADLPRLIKLNTNESPFPPSPRVLQAIRGDEAGNLRLYPDPRCGAFVEAVAKAHEVKPENVFPGNGSDEILAFCFHGLCPNGAAYPDVTYGFYEVFASMFQVPSSVIPLRDNFTINVDDYEGVRGSVFIANPNAPTGICLPVTDIERLLRQDRDRLLVVDEAYVDFGGDSALTLLAGYDNLLVIRTLSKSRSLAGARVGYALGSRELTADLDAMRYSFNPYNLNRLSILAGKEAMGDQAYFEQCRQRIISSREYCAAQLRGLGFTVLDSKANFLFVGDHEKLSAREYYEALRRNGILIRYFDGPRTENYVRITIGTHLQMEHFIFVTKELLNQ